MTKSDQPESNDGFKTPAQDDHPLAPEDFYYEGPFLVFTEAYHLKRGYCCNSNCRHCPYR
jgi:hypothetical protein